MAIYKIITPYEIFVYMNGRLIFKKWFNSTQSLVFDVMPYDRHTLMSYTDEMPQGKRNVSILLTKNGKRAPRG